MPCFSLTGPTSGSDAATMRDIGYVTRGTHEGKETLGIRLSWDKRYITLGPEGDAASASPSACSTRTTCSARARTSASRWR